MDYKLNFENFSGVFAVPDSVVDEYIQEACGVYIKVLLLIIKNCQQPLTPAQIGKKVNLGAHDVKEAISFWVSKGVLILPSANTAGKASTERCEQPHDTQETEETEPKIISPIIPKPNKIALGDIAQRLNKDEELRFLMKEVETALGKVLNTTEQRTLIYVYEETRLPADIILMAVDISVKRDKPNIRSIRKECEKWADLGLCDHESVDAYIREQHEKEQHYNKVRAFFGIGSRPFTTREKTYIEKWYGEYNMPHEMVKRAYEICADSTGSMSFPYINKVLKNWKESGIFKVGDIIQPESKKKRNNSSRIETEPSFDIDELETRGIKFKKRRAENGV
ncbi:MAG: DnaD domain protein [Oscillospiraceae bacterium]|nr:DnaD domain protein [Oscillospiraceae bacterium]